MSPARPGTSRHRAFLRAPEAQVLTPGQTGLLRLRSPLRDALYLLTPQHRQSRPTGATAHLTCVASGVTLLSPHERNGGETDYLQGALDLPILNPLALAPSHGWGIQQRIRQASREALSVSHGSLYPALPRLEAAGLVSSEMTVSDNNRGLVFTP